MKVFKWLIFICLVIVSGFANAQGIDFKSGSWKYIKEKALQQNKIIFIDCYTTWCSPCKWMDKNTFSNDSVGMFYNQHFINIKMNMEKGEGIQIKNQYNVDAYPSYLFIDGEGNLIYRTLGACSPKVFIQIGKDALNPKNNIKQTENQFFDTTDKMVSDADVAAKLLRNYKIDVNKTNALLDFYIPKLKSDDWHNTKHYKLLNAYLSYPYSATFDYFLKNYNMLAALFSADSLNALMVRTCRGYYFSRFYKDSAIVEARMSNLIERIGNCGCRDKEIAVAYIQLKYAEKKILIPEYIEITGFLCQHSERGNISFIKNNIDFVFQNCRDTALQMQALMWIKPLVADDSNIEHQFYFANMLYKAGQKERGITEMEKTIEMAGKFGLDTKMYSETLIEMMKNRKVN